MRLTIESVVAQPSLTARPAACIWMTPHLVTVLQTGTDSIAGKLNAEWELLSKLSFIIFYAFLNICKINPCAYAIETTGSVCSR